MYVFHRKQISKKHLLVSESYCRIAIVLFIYVSYTNKIRLYQEKEKELEKYSGWLNLKDGQINITSGLMKRTSLNLKT